MFILKILFIFFIYLNISSSYASNIKNSAVVFMYHKFGVSKYPSTRVTLDQFDSHLKEFTKNKYCMNKYTNVEFVTHFPSHDRHTWNFCSIAINKNTNLQHTCIQNAETHIPQIRTI